MDNHPILQIISFLLAFSIIPFYIITFRCGYKTGNSGKKLSTIKYFLLISFGLYIYGYNKGSRDYLASKTQKLKTNKKE